MILSSDDIREAIEEYSLVYPCTNVRAKWIEGCSFDLRLSRVEKRDLMSNPIIITEGYRKLPKYNESQLNEDGLWVLQPHNRYKLTSVEEVAMPSDVWGDVKLRRTFPECGLLPFGTGIATGYHGTLSIIVYNVDPYPVFLGPNALFATVVFSEVTKGKSDPYKGPRQGNVPLSGKVRPT